MLTGEADVVAEDAAGDGGDEAGEDDDAGDLARVRLVPRGVVHDHGSRHCARRRRGGGTKPVEGPSCWSLRGEGERRMRQGGSGEHLNR